MPRRVTAYRSPAHPDNRKRGAGGTLIGVFIGILIGLGLAVSVAYYLMKGGSPYQTTASSGKDAGRSGKVGEAPAPNGKPRFDFYKILPGIEEPKVALPRSIPDKTTADSAVKSASIDSRPADTPMPVSRSIDRFFLQAGAFSNESEAENLKARLALSGWEATVQPASAADKSALYRVRLGPYDNADEMNRMKGELAKRGFTVAVIKNP